jgi:hypothetical protein
VISPNNTGPIRNVEVGGSSPLTSTVKGLVRSKKWSLRTSPSLELAHTETGDDGAAYGVEVLLSDGREVEVNLDRNLNVIGQEADD